MSEVTPPAERSGPEQSRLNELLRDFQEWRLSKGLGGFSINFLEEEEAWEISLGRELPSVLAYLSAIDSEFYHEHTAVFLETQVGEVGASTDLARFLRFAADEMVLSRLSLRSEGEEALMVVESACPFQLVRFELLELMLQEVSAIGADLIDLAEGRIEEDLSQPVRLEAP